MERNANYVLVGFASLVTFIAMVVFVIWLGRFQFNRDFDLYDIYFTGPVRGLTQGGEVQFNGIKVGEVTKLSLDQKDPSKVVARVRIDSNVPVRTDSYATLEPQGITFVSYVQITAGSKSMPLVKTRTPRGVVPVIPSKPGALAELLEGGGTVLAHAVEALDRVNRVLSDRNITTFSAALSDVSSVTAELNARKQIFADAQAALQNIDQAANEISQLSRNAQGVVNTDGKRALADISRAAEELRAASAEARSTITTLRGPVTDFSTTTLPQVQATIASLQSTAESLERLVNEIENDPRNLVTKPPAKEVELKQ